SGPAAYRRLRPRCTRSGSLFVLLVGQLLRRCFEPLARQFLSLVQRVIGDDLLACVPLAVRPRPLKRVPYHRIARPLYPELLLLGHHGPAPHVVPRTIDHHPLLHPRCRSASCATWICNAASIPAIGVSIHSTWASQ